MPALIVALDDEADILELLKVNLEKAGYRFEGFQEAEDLYRYPRPGEAEPHPPRPDAPRDRRSRSLPSHPEIRGPRRHPGHHADRPGRRVRQGRRARARRRRLCDQAVLGQGARRPDPRRPAAAGGRGAVPPDRSSAPCVIDLDKFEVTVAGAKVELTATEFKILQLLASRPGRVFTPGPDPRFPLGHGKGGHRQDGRRPHPQSRGRSWARRPRSSRISVAWGISSKNEKDAFSQDLSGTTRRSSSSWPQR